MTKVKNFKRGTKADYEAGEKDGDTLYFVSENGDFDPLSLNHDEEGDIYLGETRLTREMVQPDWEQNTVTADDYIKNKPAIREGIGNKSIVEGSFETNESIGNWSHSEGARTIAYSNASHAEGLGVQNTILLTSSTDEGSTDKDYQVFIGASVPIVGNVIVCNGNYVTVTATHGNRKITLSETLGTLYRSSVKVWTSSAIGFGSHIEGESTMTNNQAEHAEGAYNFSNTGDTDAEKTISSIGIGTSNTARKNAVEVMRNGNVYIYGVGNYDGTNESSDTTLTLQEAINQVPQRLITQVTYSELVTLKTSGNLIPGMQYRITDYACTTIQPNTSSAGHVFDIIVTADSETELNENAHAAHHEGDTYFTDCELDSWKLKYCLDNDTNRFAWASPTSYPSLDIEKLKVAYSDLPQNLKDMIANDSIDYDSDEVGFFYNETSGHIRLYLFSHDNGQSLYTEYYVKLYDDVDYAVEDSAIIGTQTECEITSINGSSELPGKGVVYYMKDEYDNVAPFDFKNIRFTRSAQWFYDNHEWTQDVLGSSFSGEDTDFYFLSWVNEDGEVEDASIVCQTLMNDEDSYSGVYGNEIKETTAYNMSLTEDATSTAFALPCTIIVNSYTYDNGFFYGCYSNKFENNCINNSFGNNCYQNSLGEHFQSNLVRNGFVQNTFGNNCYQNSFWNDCYGNSFRNNCNDNSFRNSCSGNSFGNYCSYSTFLNDCRHNKFGNNCNNNSFGNHCLYNSFGNNCQYNSFGNNCQYNSFGNYCQTITVFDGVLYCSVTGGSSSAPVKNSQILNGVAGTSPSNRLTITFAQNKTYTQIAALRDDSTNQLTPQQRLVIWDATDASVQSDWEEDDNTSPSYIQNKPSIKSGTGDYSIIEGDLESNTASGNCSHAEGADRVARGPESHAEGKGSTRTITISSTQPGGTTYSCGPQDTRPEVGNIIIYKGLCAEVMSVGKRDFTVSQTLGNLTSVVVTVVTDGALGNYSHVEGLGTIAFNEAEHAEGSFNYSNPKAGTISSIGIGRDPTNRENAVEVLSDGEVYIHRIGGYDGTNSGVAGVKSIRQVIDDIDSNIHSYTIESVSPDTGYLTAYQLKEDGVAKGAKINIPKDMVVSNGEVKTVAVADEPYEGAQVGDKYIDLTIANATTDHLYIPVKDLVDLYYAGNGLSLSGTTFSVVIDPNNANGLSVGASGVALATATTSSAGAMSAADKTKLEGIASGAEVNVQSDWNQTDHTSDDFIKNKPSIPTATSDLTNDSGFITSADVPSPADTAPLMDGTATVGTSTDYAREDHVHPSDTSKQDVLTAGTDLEILPKSTVLPDGYIELEYIESSGAQYIDTGVLLSNTDKFEIKFQRLATTTTMNPMFGAISGGESYTSTSNFSITYAAQSYAIYCDGNAGNSQYAWKGGDVTDRNIHTIVYNGLNIAPTIDGVSMTQGTSHTLTQNTPTVTTWIFGRNTSGGGIKYNTGLRVFYCKIWNGNTLIRDMYPARRLSDSAVGMYDVANDVFYQNLGDGAFDEGTYIGYGGSALINFTNETGYITSSDIADKADKVSNATNGNFAGLDANGNLLDSGYSYSSFLASSTTIPTIIFRQW